ncbi:hypothetical protein D1007_51566 [Hordeum vulgare]|nr:hypothetical protein D1007_51566 [Hordeum vulgare]
MSSSTGIKLGGAPSWLRPLLGARFFQPCAAHPQLVKNECNHYCLNCAGEENAVCCPMCLSGHRDHHVLQIRKSSRYGEVIRVGELEEVADISLVQPYVVNHDRAVYLNPRPQALQQAVKYFGPAGECLVCGRRLVEANFRYCSLGCKEFNWEYSDSDSNEGENGSDNLPGPSNFQPIRGTSYRLHPRKGVSRLPERAPFY